MVKDLFDTLIKESDNLRSGEEFIVKDLMLGYKWKRIPVDIRRNLGRMFFDYCLSKENTRFEKLDKTIHGQQIYRTK